jgi:hypothetical protein
VRLSEMSGAKIGAINFWVGSGAADRRCKINTFASVVIRSALRTKHSIS